MRLITIFKLIYVFCTFKAKFSSEYTSPYSKQMHSIQPVLSFCTVCEAGGAHSRLLHAKTAQERSRTRKLIWHIYASGHVFKVLTCDMLVQEYIIDVDTQTVTVISKIPFKMHCLTNCLQHLQKAIINSCLLKCDSRKGIHLIKLQMSTSEMVTLNVEEKTRCFREQFI